MKNNFIFNFKADISKVLIPSVLNNPFAEDVPKIAKIAAEEFQEFIVDSSENWDYDFDVQKGKMWGVLVVELANQTYGYLGAVSGKLPNNIICEALIPSVFDESVGNYFINKGMTQLTKIGNLIKDSDYSTAILRLTAQRRAQSTALQQRLFENYHFSNIAGKESNLLEIFQSSSNTYPPAAAGECAAPKLLQYAFSQNLKPIALTEFWWGNALINKDKKHQAFYPACKDRCCPILEYMLADDTLFDQRFL